MAPLFIRSLLVSLFFLSGASGLIYEVLWLRLFGFVFGVTLYALSAVLASFMLGLALGSELAGRWADRLRRPLALYGIAELLIGLGGLMTPWVVARLQEFYPWLYHQGLTNEFVLGVLRFLLASAFMLFPTTLMGATLPLIVLAVQRRWPHLGRNVSLIYAFNTLGATAGTFAAGFYLIGLLGIRGSLAVAIALNSAAGIGAVLLSWALEGRALRPTAPAPVPVAGASQLPEEVGAMAPRLRQTVLWVLALSGFTGLAYEVVWFRILGLFADGTTYAFTLMLVMVLLGIGLGSYLVQFLIPRPWPWAAILALIEATIGLWAVGSLPLYAWLPGIAERLPLLPNIFGPLAERRLVALAFLALLTIFPPSLLFGTTMPIAAHLYASSAGEEGRRLGRLYASNVVGAMLGSLAGGLLLVPLLGMLRTLILLASLSIAAAIALLMAIPSPLRTLRFLTAGALLGALVATSVSVVPLFSALLQQRFGPDRLLWYREGLESTVSVIHTQGGYTALFLDSRHQASDFPPVRDFHRLIGHLPMMLHPHPRDVMVIGLGGGATTGAISLYDGVEIEVVELEQRVLDAARFFSHINDDILHSPRVHFRIADGRNHLLLTRRQYDIITADPIIVYHAGSSNLYSKEFLTLVRNALRDEGYFVQWLDQSLPEDHYKLLVRTFLHVFPYATTWHQGGLFIGSKSPITVSLSQLAARGETPGGSRFLQERGLPSPRHALDWFVTDQDTLRAYVGSGPLLSDDRPYLEYFRTFPRQATPASAVIPQLRTDVARILVP